MNLYPYYTDRSSGIAVPPGEGRGNFSKVQENVMNVSILSHLY
jgi:hypothetical protein